MTEQRNSTVADLLRAKPPVDAPKARFRLMASAELTPLVGCVHGQLARLGWQGDIATLPFNTLQQALHARGQEGRSVFLLLPWDFLPAGDWRSGIPASPASLGSLMDEISAIGALLAAWPNTAFLLLPAPLPPLCHQPGADVDLARRISAEVAILGGGELPPDAFSLTAYLETGFPLSGRRLAEVALRVVEAALPALRPVSSAAKILVTDLDNVVWQGVVAEDGLDGICWRAEGHGWRSFLYQTMVRRLRAEGVLVAAVSRNRPEDALAPLRLGEMVLGEDDFVAVLASYQAKSAQIRLLAEQLSLNLDSFVFVDDNPVELAEVEQELPMVRRLAFPATESQMPDFLVSLANAFAKEMVTNEDRQRTEMYRRRVAGAAPSTLVGADLQSFLAGLDMQLIMRDRSQGDHDRAVQLINKTNQFNLNGIRRSDEDIAVFLERGGRLVTGELQDRIGSHGEVLACLVDADGTVETLVMSCRVLQRRAEIALLVAMLDAGIAIRRFHYVATERNSPIASFLAGPGFGPAVDRFPFDAPAFLAAHADSLALFNVAWPR